MKALIAWSLLALIAVVAAADVEVSHDGILINGTSAATVQQTNVLQTQIDALSVALAALETQLASQAASIIALQDENAAQQSQIDALMLVGIPGLDQRMKVVNDKIWTRSPFKVVTDECFDSLGQSGGTGVDESICTP